jgi:acylpyruvate hydrolase
MKLATIRLADGKTAAVRVDGDTLVHLGATDVGSLLAQPDWRSRAAAVAGTTSYAAADATFATLVPTPSKVVCVGLNYKTHIQEMGRDLPEYPTLFAKFADCLIGATDDILRPGRDDRVRLGGRAGRRHRQHGPARNDRAGRGRNRRLHGAQRHHLP